jgi:hypothetical protein
MPQGLLILPLLGGFLLLHLAHVFRFSAQRYDGYRLLLRSAVAGVFLLVFGRVLVLLFGLVPWLGPWAGEVWYHISPFPHSDSCGWSLALGPILAKLVINRMYGIEAAKNKQLEQDNDADSLTRLLHVAATNKKLISVTLDSRKWYVGYVAEAPNLSQSERYFRVLPVLSGFRDKDTLKTIRTVFYEEILDAENADDFVITLPIADVKSANFFDPDIYEAYFAERGAGSASGGSTSSAPALHSLSPAGNPQDPASRT